VVAVWFVAAVLLHVTGADQYAGPDLLVRLLGLVAGLAIAWVLARWRLWTYLGSRTLPVYLAHTPLIIVLAYAAHVLRHERWVTGISAALPVLLTLTVIPAALILQTVAVRVGLTAFYAPPARVNLFVRRLVTRNGRSGEPAGSDRAGF
jgi:fucose 4-O-acetylase-like acetyltransferase